MKTDQLAEVAVAGPLRQRYTYLVPSRFGTLYAGQRLLVPFGRSRRLGFFLAPGRPQADISLREIIRPLESSSFFGSELFAFCLWMARYYLANPADCLAAALPPSLKSRRAVTYRWSETTDPVPPTVRQWFQPGKAITKATLEALRERRSLLATLIGDGIVEEQWPVAEDSSGGGRFGYRIADPAAFSHFFADGKFQPKPFDSILSRAQLLETGWTDYQLGKARKQGVLDRVRRESEDILSFIDAREEVAGIELTEEQQEVLASLTSTLDSGFQASLLHGVTGSGKTIVYCRLCREILRQDKTALVLTPEIALTGTTLAYFRGCFGDEVTVIHSAMTQRERLESWRGIRSGKYRIVVGPRSALFAPLDNLGLIVVDEEHDPSYKQDDPSPRFHGRDAAVMRGKMADIPVVLGSASPSIESYHHAREGRYRLLKLRRRPAGAKLPTVRVIDMRRDRLRGDLPFFSYPLKKEVQKRLDDDHQVILFINRRGHSPQLKCAACGHVPMCPSCRIHLTYHRVGRKLTCHYCGHAEAARETCNKCGHEEIIYLGAGTQKVEESLTRLFKDVRPIRLDSDAAAGRVRAHRILSEFGSRKYNLLLGTQMVTKGLDFPGVTLVGVLAADLSLDLPDFRASERTFARLLQVAGRSGRSEERGEVLIQTFYPESELIDEAAHQDYESFFEREIESRRALDYPPFSRLVHISLSSKNEELLKKGALELRDRLREITIGKSVITELLGPAPCPLYYLRGRYRRHLIVKTHRIMELTRILSEWELKHPRFGLSTAVRVVVDIDPDDMM